jgi:molybdopterin synthase catalytic subunit/molybdopterin converting factor small subunit
MKVTVRLFAVLRERAGRESVELELDDGATVRDAIAAVPAADGVPVVMAVNREVAPGDLVLHANDELALIPPVSGGAIHSEPLSVEALLQRVRDPRAGAVVTFSGVTREVDFLDYEAYTEMADEQIEVIVVDAIERHGLCRAAADHRVGRVELGEPSVIVAASAPHREAAFAGAREIIDEIKARVPIWKREEGEWIHPA